MKLSNRVIKMATINYVYIIMLLQLNDFNLVITNNSLLRCPLTVDLEYQTGWGKKCIKFEKSKIGIYLDFNFLPK